MEGPVPAQHIPQAAPAERLDQAQAAPAPEAVTGRPADATTIVPEAAAADAKTTGATEPEVEAMDEDYMFGTMANPKPLAVPEAPAGAVAAAVGLNPASTPAWPVTAPAGGCSQLLGFSSGNTPHKAVTGRGAGSGRAAQRRARGRGTGHSSAAGPRWQPESLEGIGESSDPADEPQNPKQQRTAARGDVATSEDAEQQPLVEVDDEIESHIPPPDNVIMKATAAGARARQQQAVAAAATPSHQQRQQQQQQQQWQPRETGISAGSSTTCNICASEQSDSSSDGSVTGPFAGGGAGGVRAVLDNDEVESVGLQRLAMGAAAAGHSQGSGTAAVSGAAAGKH